MKTVLKLILILSVKQSLACGSTSFKIINGQEASVWPWMVSLQSTSQGSHFCAGSLIASQYVLTAAHCVSSRSFNVIAGTNNLNEANPTTFQVSKVFSHEGYSSVTYDNDIALIKLTQEINTTSTISTICLPNSADENTIINQQVYTAGWGYTSPSGPSSKILYQTTMKVSDNTTICPIDPNLHYCVYDPSANKSNVCYGDSGGPLMYWSEAKWYLYGITSFVFVDNNKYCLNNYSSYFTKVPKYIDWINQKMLDNKAFNLSLVDKTIVFFVLFFQVFFFNI